MPKNLNEHVGENGKSAATETERPAAMEEWGNHNVGRGGGEHTLRFVRR